MPAKIYGYAENSADIETMQAYAGVDIIAEDMEERGQYRILRRFLREGDTLLVVRLSALGNSAEAIRAELDYLQKQEVRLRVLELPITMQELDAVSVATVYRTLQEVLLVYQQQSEEREVERSIRQQDGIQTAKKAGRRFGRPAIGYPRSWKHILGQWQAREISALDASRKLKMSRSTFYRMVKRYRQSEKGGGDVCLS